MARTRIALGLLVLPGGVALVAATFDGATRLLGTGTAPGGDPAAAVAGLASLLAAGITAWLTLCLALALAVALPGAAGETARCLRDRVTPVVVRRWAAVVLGASVTATFVPGTAVSAVRAVGGDPAPAPGWAPSPLPSGSPTSPSTSTPPRPGPSSLPGPGWGTTSVPTQSPSPGWVPTRPAPRQRSEPQLLTGRHRGHTGDERVAVRRGDTLWSIAAARLGPDATDAEIAREWPRWHAANTEVVGDDPHTLLPGTLLTPPTD